MSVYLSAKEFVCSGAFALVILQGGFLDFVVEEVVCVGVARGDGSHAKAKQVHKVLVLAEVPLVVPEEGSGEEDTRSWQDHAGLADVADEARVRLSKRVR